MLISRNKHWALPFLHELQLLNGNRYGKKQEAALHRQCPKRMQAYFMIVIFFPDEISTAVTDPAVAAEHFL